jgi:hypothetical protein
MRNGKVGEGDVFSKKKHIHCLIRIKTSEQFFDNYNTWRKIQNESSTTCPGLQTLSSATSQA